MSEQGEIFQGMIEHFDAFGFKNYADYLRKFKEEWQVANVNSAGEITVVWPIPISESDGRRLCKKMKNKVLMSCFIGPSEIVEDKK